MKKIVYITLEADIIHPGNINIIESANKYGDVIVGLLTDEAIGKNKRIPLLDYEQRKIIIQNIKNVKKVIPQTSFDYSENLQLIKPDYVVHGDDWKKGPQEKMRSKVIEILSEWGGELVEVPYTKGLSTTELITQINKLGTLPEKRKGALKKLINLKPIVKLLEVHNGITGLIVENLELEKGDTYQHFDGMWLSSLTSSASKGKPDTELVDFSSRFQTIEDIIEVTTKPIVVDGDTGGSIQHFPYRVRTLERLGVSAIIIEDKVGNKRNSLFGTNVYQQQDTIKNFTAKISAGRKACLNDQFMIIARIESFILNKGMDHAIERTKAYIDAGADGIMIHSKEKDVTEIRSYCKYYNKNNFRVPLVVAPSTFPQIKEEEMINWGIKMVIYANHLLRSAYPAMIKTGKSILKYGRAKEASEKYCMSIKEIISLIPED